MYGKSYPAVLHLHWGQESQGRRDRPEPTSESGSRRNDEIEIRNKHREQGGDAVSRKVPEKFMSILPMNP